MQLSNQAQASVDGDSSLPAESTWTTMNDDNNRLRFPTRHLAVVTPPPNEYFLQPMPSRVRMLTPPPPSAGQYMMGSSPPPPPPEHEHVMPTDARLISSSSPLNPWNPYLRSYGRVYHNLPYENSPQNWVISNRENDSTHQSLPTYQSRAQLDPSYREFDSTLNPIPSRGMYTLRRPRSSNRSFHHYRDVARNVGDSGEHANGYMSLPVIEISSDEEDTRPMPADFFRPTNRNGSHSPSFSRCNPNSGVVLTPFVRRSVLSPSNRNLAEFRSNGLQHIKNAYSDENISSTANHEGTSTAALNLCNKMKRPHRHSLHSSSKHFRVNHPSEERDSRNTPETTNSNSSASNDAEQLQRKPNVNEINTSVNTTSSMPSNYSIDNDDGNVERKFKIRIKNEFKCEPKSSGENSEPSNDVVDTKENLQPLIADIKKE